MIVDAAGNIIGRRSGADRKAAAAACSALTSTAFLKAAITTAVVGSLGAIEVAQTLIENKITTRHPLEVIIFQNEEGGLIGSRAIDGELTEKELDLVSRSGKTIREGINYIGGDVSKLAGVRRKRAISQPISNCISNRAAYCESEKIDIGIVEGIVGINWWDVTIEGFANHAGHHAHESTPGRTAGCGQIH